MSPPDNVVFDYPLWAVPADQQHILLVIACVLAGLSFLYAVWMAVRCRDLFPIAIFLGAGLSVIYEPLGDILTKVAYPPLEQVSLMTSFGRPTPLWMLPNYFFFFCTPVLLLLQFVIRQDMTMRKYWIAYAIMAVFVAAFEQPGINGDLWRYYASNSAFSVNSYPVWVAFANSASLFVIATGVFLLRRSVIPPRLSFLFILLVPILFVGSHVGPTIPVAWAVYTTENPLVVNAAAVLAIGMCLLTVWIAGQLVIRQAEGKASL